MISKMTVLLLTAAQAASAFTPAARQLGSVELGFQSTQKPFEARQGEDHRPESYRQPQSHAPAAIPESYGAYGAGMDNGGLGGASFPSADSSGPFGASSDSSGPFGASAAAAARRLLTGDEWCTSQGGIFDDNNCYMAPATCDAIVASQERTADAGSYCQWSSCLSDADCISPMGVKSGFCSSEGQCAQLFCALQTGGEFAGMVHVECG